MHLSTTGGAFSLVCAAFSGRRAKNTSPIPPDARVQMSVYGPCFVLGNCIFCWHSLIDRSVLVGRPTMPRYACGAHVRRIVRYPFTVICAHLQGHVSPFGVRRSYLPSLSFYIVYGPPALLSAPE